MRIAYVCADPGVPVFGSKGSSIHVQEVIRVLRRDRHEVELFATRIDGLAPVDLANVPVHQLPALPQGNVAAREAAARQANPVIAKLLQDKGPFDFIYERYSLWSTAGMDAAQSLDTPGVLEVNAPLIEEQATYRELHDREAAEEIAAQAFAAATVLISVSTGVAKYLEGFPAARGKIAVVPNGVNIDRFPRNMRPSQPAEPGVVTVGFVGTLKPWHGVATLVEAFAVLHVRRPNTRLLIVGDGPERTALEADVNARGLSESTVFTGAVPAEAIPGLVASMDIAVAPYPNPSDCYFSPLKVYEYMAAERAVVASRIGQITSVIQHGFNGLLCAPGDADSLLATLDTLAESSAWRTHLGESARATIRLHHTWTHVVRKILRLVRQHRLQEVAG